jgi:Flp pilus assembly protein TadD
MKPVPADKRLNEARRLLQEHNFAQALPAYEKLTKHLGNKALIWYEYGSAACGVGLHDLAEKAWGKVLELEPGNSELLRKVGLQYEGLHRRQKARAAFEQAVKANSRDSHSHLALAELLERSHRVAEAREALAASLALDPRNERARCFAALLDWRENKIEEAERGLRDLMASGPRNPDVQYGCRYQLAQLLDRTDRFDEAMETLAEAKRLLRGLADVPAMLKQYDQFAAKYRHTTEALPANILRTWSKEFPEKSRAAIPRLAFLGGHPRSGTTLLEQLMGAHPEVGALDEPKAFTSIVVRLFNDSAQLSPARLNVIRRSYVEALQKELGDGTEHKLILDKNPTDTMKLCIWLRVFPELRVLIALRDPRDVVISCYFQNFPLNPFTANYLFFERTATHYANLMAVWLAVREWEGLTGMETRYADVVADLEKEGRRVTDFLGLTWHPEQARFHEKSCKKHLYAATYHDATQPIYQRSLARWRAYEKHLASSLPILKPYCRAFGYET